MKIDQVCKTCYKALVPKGKTKAKVQSQVAIVSGMSVSQSKAIEALLQGQSLYGAAKAAGVAAATLKQWLASTDGAFSIRLSEETKALDDRITRARKALIDSVIQTGNAGSSRLLQHVQSANEQRSLSASKAAYAGAVALAKGADADVSNVGPMFVLPAGTVMSLDTAPPPLPPTIDALAVQVIDKPADKAAGE